LDKLHNGELHNLPSSPDIIGMMKSQEMKCGKVLVEKSAGGRPLQGLDGRIMLKLILDMSKLDGTMRTEFIWLRKSYSIES
jgi:hypothetical protein